MVVYRDYQTMEPLPIPQDYYEVTDGRQLAVGQDVLVVLVNEKLGRAGFVKCHSNGQARITVDGLTHDK